MNCSPTSQKPLTTNSFPVGGRSTWVGILALVGILGAVEIAAIAFLGHTFLPPVAAWTLDVVGVLVLILSALAMASVLWRRHALSDTDVVLVLGYLAQIRIPIAHITSVTPAPALTGHHADRTGPTLTGDRLNLVAAAGVPRVVVDLTVPVNGRRLWQRRPVMRAEASDEMGALTSALLERTGPAG